MEKFAEIVGVINGWVWGPWLLVLLVGTHIFLTVRTGFIQRKLGLGIKLSVSKDKDSKGDVSQFGALTTALASTIGTGNIVGVGTAIALGGPGALLWMWLTGVFGIATKYAESLIAVKYRVIDDKGMMIGGAMFALERGLKMKWLGAVFAFLTAVAAFGIGSGVQSNAVAGLVNSTFGVPHWITGLVLAVFVAVVVIGGLKWIARVSEALVPFMAVIYVIGCIILLVINGRFILPAIALVCSNAFNFKAASGGAAGFIAVKMMTAARYGVARGLFSNESGMGSAPIVAAAAQTRNPVRQALVSSTGTFWDTVVICLMTGLVIISSGLAHQAKDTGIAVIGLQDSRSAISIGKDGNWLVNGKDTERLVLGNNDEIFIGIGEEGKWLFDKDAQPALRNNVDDVAGANSVITIGRNLITIGENDKWLINSKDTGTSALDKKGKPVGVFTIGENGNWFIGSLDMTGGGVLVSTAFSQIPLVGSFILTFGLITFAFSTILGWCYYGEKGLEYLLGTKSIVPYRVIYTLIAFLGTILSLDLVWNIADTLNGLMTIPNIIAMLLLSGVIVAETKKYLTGNNIDLVDNEPVPLRSDLDKKS